jgi:hypothetical protein
VDIKTKDHPEANGRAARLGEAEYTFRFTSETGEVITVRMGADVLDMLTEAPSY